VSPVARLAGFAAGLAVVGVAAALAGTVSGVDPGRPAAARGAMAHGEPAPDAVRGLAVSGGGLTLQLATTTAPAGRPTELRFRIADRAGRTVRAFDVEHTKRMHLIVVRRDMTGFRHLHPHQQRDGSWSVPVALSDAGTYRVFADFSVGGRPRTLAADLFLDGATRSRPLPAATNSVAVDGMRVALSAAPSRAGAESDLRFTVTRGGRPVALQDYLGAKGHLVALRDGDLAFLHVHPDEDAPRFMAEFPSAGRYRLFLQFRVDGRVHTAEFTREVSR